LWITPGDNHCARLKRGMDYAFDGPAGAGDYYFAIG
jgi:hypothetical protein